MLAALNGLEAAHVQARDGGGEKAVTRHHARGKLLPRERIELLVDRDTALLELAATAPAGLVTALGVIENVPSMLVASDPTIDDGLLSPEGARKLERALHLASTHRLPVVLLLESGPESSRGLAAVTAAASPAASAPLLCALFGPLEPSLALLPELAHHTIAVRGQGDHLRHDLQAEDERDALRLLRQTMRRLTGPAEVGRPCSDQTSHHRSCDYTIGDVELGRIHPQPTAARAVVAPRFDAEELLPLVSADPLRPSEVTEVLARILDGSEFDEFRPGRPDLIAGFGAIHGHPVAVMANVTTELDAESVPTGIDLLRLAEAANLPLVLLANPCSGRDRTGELLRALAHSDLPRITVVLGADPGEWALLGNGFRFRWPVTTTGQDAADDPLDGILDPRDTRTVLGICLSICAGRSNSRGWRPA